MKKDNVRKWLGMPSTKYLESLAAKEKEKGENDLPVNPRKVEGREVDKTLGMWRWPL